MAGHRSDDQEAWPFFDPVTGEMLELPERLAEQNLLFDVHLLAADLARFESPNSGFPRGAEAWAKTSRLAATVGPIAL